MYHKPARALMCVIAVRGNNSSEAPLPSGVAEGGVALCPGVGVYASTFCEAGGGGRVMNGPFGQKGEKAIFRSVVTA